MNRGGLTGASFTFDDRFTAFDAASLAGLNFDGGKMLCRIDPTDAATVRTLEACAHAVTELAALQLLAMVEPFWMTDGRNDLSPDAIIRSIAVAQALGTTSAHTWLKLPAIADMARVLEATMLPVLLLGGDPAHTPYDLWAKALEHPGVRGLVAGRALLYPADDDVVAAVDTAVDLL